MQNLPCQILYYGTHCDKHVGKQLLCSQITLRQDSLVRLHMLVHGTLLHETFITLGTLVWYHPRVLHQMPLEIALSCESLVTCRAGKGLQNSVYLQMTFEVHLLIKRLATDSTFEMGFLRMHPLVPIQLALE